MASGDSSSAAVGASLAPGFRFHPTNEELVRYYLKRKVTNKPFRFDAIAVVDIYRNEPWDLPDKSKLKTRDLEWYFYSMLDKKYGSGSKTNRATEKGYWKTTGKDRPIRWNSQNVGMKKTLVYHLGRAPRGERTNWVMHEYRLTDEDLQKAGVVQDAFVLCRLFQKSGTGPKNGEQYGAPFIEEEWENDDKVVLLPGEKMVMVATDEAALDDDAYVGEKDLDQKFDVASESVLPVNYYHGETSNCLEQAVNIVADDHRHLSERGDTQYYSDLPVEVDAKLARQKSDDFTHIDYLLDESFFDAIDNTPFSEGLFLEADDLSNPVEPDSAGVGFDMVDEYLSFLDANDDNLPDDLSNPVEPDSVGDSTGFDMVDEYLSFSDANDDNLTFDPSELMGSEDVVSDEAFLCVNDMNEGTTEEVPISNQELLEKHNNIDGSSSKQQKPEQKLELEKHNDIDGSSSKQQMPEPKLESEKHNDIDGSSSKQQMPEPKLESDIKYPFMKKASQILGNISAPPAFASEFPLKGTTLQLNGAPSSSTVHVIAGVIRTDNITFGRNGWSGLLTKMGMSISSSLLPCLKAMTVQPVQLLLETYFWPRHGRWSDGTGC